MDSNCRESTAVLFPGGPEHSLAVALLAASIASAMLGRHGASRGPWAAASGALGGVSVLLRPEAAWFVAGLGPIIGRTQWMAFGGGVAAILVPSGAANYIHFGDGSGHTRRQFSLRFKATSSERDGNEFMLGCGRIQLPPQVVISSLRLPGSLASSTST